MISVQDVTFVKYPGTDREISPLKNISLEILAGEFVAIVGRNGSGKTTLARHLNALFVPTRGRILVDGMDTADDRLRGDIRRRVGMVFQNPDHQIVAQVVQEEVAFGPENLGVSPPEIRARVDEVLRMVGLEDRHHAAPQMMSGGQKQRLAIAAILAMRPACVVFDEATTMLDPEGRQEVLDTIVRLNRNEGMTVVLITHSMQEAALAGRILVLDQGTVARNGTPAELFLDPEIMGSLGLQLPPMAELAQRLAEDGLRVPSSLLDVAGMSEYLRQKYHREMEALHQAEK